MTVLNWLFEGKIFTVNYVSHLSLFILMMKAFAFDTLNCKIQFEIDSELFKMKCFRSNHETRKNSTNVIDALMFGKQSPSVRHGIRSFIITATSFHRKCLLIFLRIFLSLSQTSIYSFAKTIKLVCYRVFCAVNVYSVADYDGSNKYQLDRI